MKTIVKNQEKTYIKEKSKFIGIILKVKNEDEILNYLNILKKEYNDATHFCYAYHLPNKIKYHDDGEPKGTAGLPILEVLEKNNLTYCLGIVIRYFGGIKLGANGLVRAYTKAISDTLIDNIKELKKNYLIDIQEDYSKKRELDYLLNNSHLIQQDYQEKVQIKAWVNEKTLEKLSSIHYSIIQEDYF